MERDTLTFADQEIKMRIESSKHILKDVDQIIDWKRINKLLGKVELRRKHVCGRDSFSPEVMFRIMLLQGWYGLSDYQMEEQLGLNIMYQWFCRLSFENPVPDHSTICRWRSRFSQRDMFEKLLSEINRQLEQHGLKIKSGLIVDATLIESQARPRKKEIIETEPVGDEEIPGRETFQMTELNVVESKDPDARWIKKGKASTYGFKGHVAVDQENGLIADVIVTPANRYDGHLLPDLVARIDPAPSTEVLADKGYDSAENNTFLESRNLVPKIMRKKKKNQAPDPELKEFNYAISQVRYKVEQTFGGLKKHFGWGRSIYLGLDKTKNYLILGAIAFNLTRSLKILRT